MKTRKETHMNPRTIRVSLKPSQVVHLDSVANTSLSLQCGDRAEPLAIVETSNFVAAGAAE